MSHEARESYDGPAQILGPETAEGTTERDVRVRLRGHFEPIDGAFHWYGRIATDRELDEAHATGSAVRLRTPYGEATGRLSDRDTWGRLRITGTGTPPF